MNIIITGGNGFVARHLTLLLHDTHHITLTARQACAWEKPRNVDFSVLDIVSAPACTNVVTKVKPDVIIHTAAMSKPDECEANKELAEQVNYYGTKNLLDAASRISDCFFVFLSTDFVFDGNRGMYTENDLPAPVNYYGETKLAAEKLVMQYEGQYAIVRTVLVYGDPLGGRDNIISQSAKALKEGKQLRIVNDQVRTPTFVNDLCKGIQQIIEQKASGIFHISGKDIVTPYQMVVAAAKEIGADVSLVTPVTEKDFTQPARRPLKTGFDISKARSVLGYEPVSFPEGLKQTIAALGERVQH